MKQHVNLVALFLAVATGAAAQVKPAATGFGLPIPTGNLRYSIRYAQTVQFGGTLGDWQTSVLSGSLNFATPNQRHPLSLDYGGGYNWASFGPGYGVGSFQHLSLSQAINWRTWNVSASDDVSYTPEAPTFGFTGIPGVGEPISSPGIAAPGSTLSILTLNTHVVNNTTSGEITHNLNYALILNLGGSYNLFRFPDGNGTSTNTASANGGLSWRLNARNSLVSNYGFSQFSFPDFAFSFQNQSAYFGMKRLWSRKISTNLSVGPQWTSSSSPATVPSSTGVTARARVTYHFGASNAYLTYYRGINGGSGYLIGAQTNNASAGYSRQFGQWLNVGFTASYYRTAGLRGRGVTTARYGGAEVTRRLGRYLTMFANYSAITQTSSALLPSNALGQFMQVFGFGFGYSPLRVRLIR